MPRIAEDPAKYLAHLKASRKGAKPGVIVNARGFAAATGATWRIVEQWVTRDRDFPIVQRGRVGQEWQFELVAGLDHLIGRADALIKSRKVREARTARLAGVGGGGGANPSPSPSDPGSPADRAADARAINALADAAMKTHRLAKEQEQLVSRAATETLLADLMTTLQTEVLAIESGIDPAGLLPAVTRELMRSELKNVLITLQNRLAAKLPEWRKSAHTL
jgi:phage terminase Nu1 subunit (DNA packaging protein)